MIGRLYTLVKVALCSVLLYSCGEPEVSLSELEYSRLMYKYNGIPYTGVGSTYSDNGYISIKKEFDNGRLLYSEYYGFEGDVIASSKHTYLDSLMDVQLFNRLVLVTEREGDFDTRYLEVYSECNNKTELLRFLNDKTIANYEVDRIEFYNYERGSKCTE